MHVDVDHKNKIVTVRVEIPLTDIEMKDILQQYPLLDGWTFREISYGQTYFELLPKEVK